ncbi:MAG: flagellar hook-associated protein 3 FlgL [Actinomycetota bacterium]|jgi:flagellar hook-associated protein 3 FlgL|nr:flagellar hook-associated protein 3 FlgL [Actinomycetota bacterium]
MRVSNQQIVSSALNGAQTQLAALMRAQAQLSSGKRVMTPSDDPAAAGSILLLQAATQSNDQELLNAQDGQAWVNGTDSQLQQASTLLQRARDLAVQAGSSLGASPSNAIATEILSIRDQLVAVANSQQQGRGLFSGFAGGAAVTQVGGVWTYTGDGGAVQRRVGEQNLVTVNVTADQVLGFSAGAGQDSVTMLENLATQVSAGNATGVSASIAGVDVALGRVNQGLAQIGSAGNRIDAALALNLNNAETIKSQLSSVQDVDLAEATMNLQTQQVAYQAALGALSKVLGPSLLDFIPRG